SISSTPLLVTHCMAASLLLDSCFMLQVWKLRCRAENEVFLPHHSPMSFRSLWYEEPAPTHQNSPNLGAFFGATTPCSPSYGQVRKRQNCNSASVCSPAPRCNAR